METLDTIDTPIPLQYNNGKSFPHNAVFVGYALLVVSIPALLGNIYIGIVLFLVSLLMCFTNYGTEIDVEKRTVKEYNKIMGFIKVGKPYDYGKFQFVTVVPVRQTTTAYGRGTSSVSSTEYLCAVCLLNPQYRNKKEITRFKQKSKCEDIAKGLAHTMNLEYFDYDPQVIRQKMGRR